MSRKPKIIPPIKAGFNDILGAIASGAGRKKAKDVKQKPTNGHGKRTDSTI